MRYYLSVECERCDNDVYFGPVLDVTGERHGLPVIRGDLLAQTRVVCDHCGAIHYFGDLDVYVEDDHVGSTVEEDL